MKRKQLLAAILSIVLIIVTLPMAASAEETTRSVTRRALVLSAPSDPNIFSTDYLGMEGAFNRNNFNPTVYQQSYYGSLTLISNKLYTCFHNADDDDVNYLYISSHADDNDYSLMISGIYSTIRLSMQQLKTWLDNYNGRFVIMIDACHSGTAIGDQFKGIDETSAAEKMVSAFFDEDETTNRDGVFCNNKYVVFCSCLEDEMSHVNAPYPNGSYSIATYYYARAIGYNILTNTSIPWQADINSDNILTANEIGNYVLTGVNSLYPNLPSYDPDEPQTPCYYAANIYYSVLYKPYPNGWPLGDVNQNDSITMADVLLIQKYLANQITLTNTQKKLADMNGVGGVTSADVLAVRQYIVAYG